jgi:hypothetical protein
VVALAAGDEAAPLGLAALEKVLAGDFQRCLDGFRAAGDEVNPRQALGGLGDQLVGKPLRRLAGEKARVGKGQAVQLRLDRIDDPRVIMAERRHGGAAGGVQIALAIGVDDVHALAAHGHRRLGPGMTVEDVTHGGGVYAAPPAPGR